MVSLMATDLIDKSIGFHFRLKSIVSILNKLDLHSAETVQHGFNVSAYATDIGLSLGLNKEKIEELWFTSILHDVGKLQIAAEIINKESKLTNDEYEKIKFHPVEGHKMISDYYGFSDIALNILQHHERYDGKGYPYGLSGTQINLMSRIITIADSFDAMISKRPYKKFKTIPEAITELKEQRWKQFDGDVVDHFIKIVKF